MIAATSRTGASGGAVTTDTVMISLIRIELSLARDRLSYNRVVAELTPAQEHTRERAEAAIALVAPALDLVLAFGDRISRVVEPEDHGYYPARPLKEEEDSP